MPSTPWLPLLASTRFKACRRFSRDSNCSNIFFYLSLRDLYLPLVPEMNSALPKLLTGFTAFFFSQVLSDFFLLSLLILNAWMYKYLFHVQPFRSCCNSLRTMASADFCAFSLLSQAGLRSDFAYYTDLPR
ncbi:hypothetical protein D3C76_914140 [compost metagenome]